MESFLDRLFELIKEEALKKGTSRETAVIEFKQPHELEVKKIKNLSIEILISSRQSFCKNNFFL